MAAAWLVPNHYPPWSSYYNELAMAVAVGLLGAAVIYSRSTLASPLPTPALGVLFVAVVPWFQWAAGMVPYSGDCWVVTLYLLGFALAIAVGSGEIGRHPETFAIPATLAWATLSGAGISALLAVCQSVGNTALGMYMVESGYGSRATANLGQPNNLATLLTWGFISLLFLRECGRIGLTAALSLVGLLLVGLALTQSRTALIQGPIILVGIWWATRRGVYMRTSLWTIGSLTLATWLMAWLVPAMLNAYFMTTSETLADRGAASPRFLMWPILLDALSTRPLQGFGWLQNGAAQFEVADRHLGTGEMWLQAHDMFLDFVLWMGYPLGLAVGALVLYWFASRWVRIGSLEALVGMLVVSVCGVHGLLEFPYQYAYFLIPIGLWIGIVEQHGYGGTTPSTRAPLGLAACCLALLLAVISKYGEVEDDFRLIRFEFLKIGTLKATQPAPDAPFLSSLTAFLSFSRTVPTGQMSSQAIECMRVQVLRYPYAVSLYRYALALALNHRTTDALSVFAKLRGIHGEETYSRMRADLQARAKVASDDKAALETLVTQLPPPLLAN